MEPVRLGPQGGADQPVGDHVLSQLRLDAHGWHWGLDIDARFLYCVLTVQRRAAMEFLIAEREEATCVDWDERTSCCHGCATAASCTRAGQRRCGGSVSAPSSCSRS